MHLLFVLLRIRLMPTLALIGLQELMIAVGLFVLLFMAPRLPSIMRAMGQSVVEFKRGLKEPVDPPADDAGPPRSST